MGAGWGRGGALQGRAHCTGTRALSHSNSLQVPSLALRRSLPEPSHSVQTEPSRPRRAGALHGRASWARPANRAAVCPWPQGARSEDSASPAARARPPSGPGGPDPVPRGPRLSSPPSPGAWRPAWAVPPGPGSAAEVRLGWGAGTRPDCGQSLSRALPERSRVHPCSQPPAGPGSLSNPAPGSRWPRRTRAGLLGRERRRGAAALPAPTARSPECPGLGRGEAG